MISTTDKEWQAHTAVVALANILRDHDFQEPAMTVLPITKNLICRKILFDKLSLFPIDFCYLFVIFLLRLSGL